MKNVVKFIQYVIAGAIFLLTISMIITIGFTMLPVLIAAGFGWLIITLAKIYKSKKH